MIRLKQLFRAIYFRIKNYMSLYGVFEKNPTIDSFKPKAADLASSHMITVAPSKKDAMAAVDKVIYFNHFEHYKLWCETRNIKIGFHEKSWLDYKQTVIGRQEYQQEFRQYSIYCMSYSPKNVAEFLRVFSGTAPLLMDYEETAELGRYLKQHSQGSFGIDIPQYLYQLINVDEIDGGKIKSLFAKMCNDPDTNTQTKTEEEKNN